MTKATITSYSESGVRHEAPTTMARSSMWTFVLWIADSPIIIAVCNVIVRSIETNGAAPAVILRPHRYLPEHTRKRKYYVSSGQWGRLERRCYHGGAGCGEEELANERTSA